MLTLRQLHYFEVLSRHLHFGKAASECAITQPALSMQIKELETELGASLIERNKAGIIITPIGEEVLLRAQTILRSVQDLRDFTEHRNHLLVGELTLGVIPTVAPYLLPKALPSIKKQYPDLILKLRESQTGKLLEELKQGRIDAALLALPVDDPDFKSIELFEDNFVLATSKHNDHPDPYQILAQQDLLLLEEGHCLRDQILAFCREKKPDALSNFGATSLSTIVQLVANGYGTTLLPEIACAVELNKQKVITTIRFPDPQPQRTIGLLWRSSSSREAEYLALGELLK